jgi:hypothetical protein
MTPKNTMNISLLDRIGEWNPQIFREFKGRLNSRNVLLGIGTSLAIQILLFLYFWVQLPSKKIELYHLYCMETEGFCTINWVDWWKDLHHSFSWILVLTLVVGGVYLLVSNLAEEQRRGTFNFIRLTPQSTYTILLGKMLGVPIIIFLGAAVALPLHIWSAIAADFSVPLLLSFYLLLGAICGLFYSLGMLYVFLGGTQGLIAAGATAFCLWLYLYIDFGILYDYYIEFQDLQWFWAPIADNLFAFRGFAIFNCLLWIYWIWRGLNRRFKNPTATIFSKKESYGFVACFQINLLGFVLPQINLYQPSNYAFEHTIYVLALINLCCFIGLIAMLSPHRPTLQDWARYSHTQNSQSRWHDWLIGEKSPAPVAIAINLGITMAIFLPWILLYPTDSKEKIWASAGIFVSCSLMLIYAVLAQLMLLIKCKKPEIWAAGTLGSLIILPLLLLGIFQLDPEDVPALYLFTPLPFLSTEHISLAAFLGVVLSHCSIIAALTWKLKQLLRLAGESQTKALLAGD